MAFRNWFIVLLVIASVCLTSSFGLFGLAFLLLEQPWLAPGDPPVFDFLVMAGAGPVALSACAWAVTAKARRGDGRLAVRLAHASFVLSAALVVIGGLGIAERHGPRWAALRTAIRHYAREINTAVGDRDRVLSPTEFEALRQRFVPKPVPVWFAGVGYVHIRMARATYPYVAVDFGGGNNVEFDPDTLFSLYL